TRTMEATPHFTVTYGDSKRQGKTHFCVVPSRELSGNTHPNFRQTHRARYKRLIIGCGRPATMEAKYAGSSRLSLGGALARAEARTGESKPAGRGQECRYDRRSSHGVTR